MNYSREQQKLSEGCQLRGSARACGCLLGRGRGNCNRKWACVWGVSASHLKCSHTRLKKQLTVASQSCDKVLLPTVNATSNMKQQQQQQQEQQQHVAIVHMKCECRNLCGPSPWLSYLKLLVAIMEKAGSPPFFVSAVAAIFIFALHYKVIFLHYLWLSASGAFRRFLLPVSAATPLPVHAPPRGANPSRWQRLICWCCAVSCARSLASMCDSLQMWLTTDTGI